MGLESLLSLAVDRAIQYIDPARYQYIASRMHHRMQRPKLMSRAARTINSRRIYVKRWGVFDRFENSGSGYDLAK